MDKMIRNYYIAILVAVIVVLAAIVLNIRAAQHGQNYLVFTADGIIFAVVVFALLRVLNLIKTVKSLIADIEVYEAREQERVRLKEEQQAKEDALSQADMQASEKAMQIVDELDKCNDISAYSEKLLQQISKQIDIVQGLCYVKSKTDNAFYPIGEYAYFSEEKPQSFILGDTISGQVAKNQQPLNLQEVPEGYMTILSGLGTSSPRNLFITPIVVDDETIAVLELAAFKKFTVIDEYFMQKINFLVGDKFNQLRN